MSECVRGLYEEIDTSGQGKWILPAVIGCIVIVGLLIVRLVVIDIGDPPFDDQPDLFFVAGLGPVGVCLLGSLFGILKKRATKVNTDLLEFNEDVRKLEDFDKVYHEGDFRTGFLGGHPTYSCSWVFVVIFSFAMGLVAALAMNTVQFDIGLAIEIYLSPILYIVGFFTAFRAMPIENKLVRNPLNEPIARYLSKYKVVSWITECGLVSKIIVRYRMGIGQTLKVIDNIHVLAVTSTEPELEIEICIDNPKYISAEYTYYLSEGLPSRKKEVIDVAGKEVHVIVDEIDRKKCIRVHYDMSSLRAQMDTRTPERQCNLMHALVDEISKYMSITKVPRIENPITGE
jgi:hypothetical protein